MYMADVSVAIRTYFSISFDEWSDGPLQLAARAITSGSRETYMSALRQFAKNSESSDTLEVAANKRICAIARRKRGRSAATGLVSALRVLEKLRLLPPSVLQLHWLQVEAIARITAPHAPPRPYGTAQHLDFLGRARIHWAWPRLFFLATCAVVFRMRSGDSESVSWEGIATPGWIEFFDQKRGKEWVQYPLSPFLEQWRKYVLSLKHPNIPPQSLVLPGGRNALRSIQKECMQHCPFGHITWHPWARMAAAAFRILGGTLASLADWRRWEDLKQARHYSKAPAEWSLPEFLSLPYPESFTGYPSREMGGVSIRTKDVWPREAWEKRTGPRKPPRSQLLNQSSAKSFGARPVKTEARSPTSPTHLRRTPPLPETPQMRAWRWTRIPQTPPYPLMWPTPGQAPPNPLLQQPPLRAVRTAPSSWMTPEMASPPPQWAPQVLTRGDQTRCSTGWRGKEQLRQNPPHWLAPGPRPQAVTSRPRMITTTDCACRVARGAGERQD